ncbi:hypothetical protein Q9189_000548 [Teloschistes chrysophthalmus]
MLYNNEYKKSLSPLEDLRLSSMSPWASPEINDWMWNFPQIWHFKCTGSTHTALVKGTQSLVRLTALDPAKVINERLSVEAVLQQIHTFCGTKVRPCSASKGCFTPTLWDYTRYVSNGTWVESTVGSLDDLDESAVLFSKLWKGQMRTSVLGVGWPTWIKSAFMASIVSSVAPLGKMTPTPKDLI